MSYGTKFTKSRKKNRLFIRVFSGVFTTIGLFLFAISIYIGVESRTFKQNAEPAEAVITSMQGRNSESLGIPFVEYTINGKTYGSALNVVTSSMRPGGKIIVYYRKDNPQEVRYLEENGWVIAVLVFMGVVFVGIGTAFRAVDKAYRRKVQRLLATGKVVDAEITDISEDTEKSMNGRHPIIISCRFVAPDGRIHLFRSASFWYESYEINPKKKVRVYMDRNNPSDYYVDVDSVVG